MTDRKTVKDNFERNTKAEEVAARLPELDLEARHLASLIQGLRNRNMPGPGTEFHRYSQFEQGLHDPRKIDYKASAKRIDRDGEDLLMVREREREVTQTIYLWRDHSKSMDYKAPAELFDKQPQFTKKEAAEILLLATAYLTAATGERFTLLGSELGLSGNKAGVQRLLHEMAHDAVRENKADEDLPKLPVHRGKPLGRNSHVFIFSDFLCPMEEIGEMLTSLHHAGVKGHLVQILDPSEVEFRYKGHVRFHSLENDFSHTVKRSESIKEEVEERIQQHINELGDMVKAIPGWNFSCYVTDQPLHEALLPLYGIKTNRMPSGGMKPI